MVEKVLKVIMSLSLRRKEKECYNNAVAKENKSVKILFTDRDNAPAQNQQNTDVKTTDSGRFKKTDS